MATHRVLGTKDTNSQAERIKQFSSSGIFIAMLRLSSHSTGSVCKAKREFPIRAKKDDNFEFSVYLYANI